MGVGTGAKLINNKKCHVRTVGQPVMAGLGPPTPGPWHPLHPDRVEAAGIPTALGIPQEGPSLLASE